MSTLAKIHRVFPFSARRLSNYVIQKKSLTSILEEIVIEAEYGDSGAIDQLIDM